MGSSPWLRFAPWSESQSHSVFCCSWSKMLSQSSSLLKAVVPFLTELLHSLTHPFNRHHPGPARLGGQVLCPGLQSKKLFSAALPEAPVTEIEQPQVSTAAVLGPRVRTTRLFSLGQPCRASMLEAPDSSLPEH